MGYPASLFTSFPKSFVLLFGLQDKAKVTESKCEEDCVSMCVCVHVHVHVRVFEKEGERESGRARAREHRASKA